MANILKTSFLGTTKKLPTKHQAEKQPKRVVRGCLFTFHYRSRTATDLRPFIIMISPKWVAKKGGTYFTGVNLNGINPSTRSSIIKKFGSSPVGSVTYKDIKDFSRQDPNCCVRTYNVTKVRALHKVEA